MTTTAKEEQQLTASDRLMRALRETLKLNPQEVGKAIDLYYSAAREKIRSKDGTMTTEAALVELLQEIKADPTHKDPYLNTCWISQSRRAASLSRWPQGGGRKGCRGGSK